MSTTFLASLSLSQIYATGCGLVSGANLFMRILPLNAQGKIS